MVKRRWRCKPGEQPTELDKRIMYLENKGWEVPTRELIKTPEQIEGIRRASAVNTGVLDAVEKVICAGMSTLEIDQICRDYCAKHNAIPACLNYGGDEETPLGSGLFIMAAAGAAYAFSKKRKKQENN